MKFTKKENSKILSNAPLILYEKQLQGRLLDKNILNKKQVSPVISYTT